MIIAFIDLRLVGNRHPAELAREVGLLWRIWEGQPIADQIKLIDVAPDSIPNPLPPWLRLAALNGRR